MKWNSWIAYARASGHRLHRCASGSHRYHLVANQLSRCYINRFVSRRAVVAHLKALAVHDLRRDALMRLDVGYAAATGDYTFIRQWTANDESLDATHIGQKTDAELAHVLHVEECRTRFLTTAPAHLDHAVALRSEFRATSVRQQYLKRLAEARANLDAEALSETLSMHGVRPVAQRVRL